MGGCGYFCGNVLLSTLMTHLGPIMAAPWKRGKSGIGTVLWMLQVDGQKMQSPLTIIKYLGFL